MHNSIDNNEDRRYQHMTDWLTGLFRCNKRTSTLARTMYTVCMARYNVYRITMGYTSVDVSFNVSTTTRTNTAEHHRDNHRQNNYRGLPRWVAQAENTTAVLLFCRWLMSI